MAQDTSKPTYNADNVAFAKGGVVGTMYRAPKGTELPTDATTPLPDVWKSVGYIGEDGLTFGEDTDTTSINEMSGNAVKTMVSSYSETVQFVMIETNEHSLKERYGDKNVTWDEDKHTYSYVHRIPDGEGCPHVVEIMKTNGYVERTVIPDGAPREFGDIQLHGSDGVGYDETMAMNASALIGGATAVTYGAKIVDSEQQSQPAQPAAD
ncbi:MAG: hypothetical protein M3Z40_01895 [Bifidobacterium sp.]|nr:hypothetical protein [Bifidobacterium sp.]